MHGARRPARYLRATVLPLVVATATPAALLDCYDLQDLSNGNADAGPSPSDGSADSGDASVEASAPTPECALDGSFCDDFDESPLGARWSHIEQSVATLTLSSNASVSSPNALVAQLVLGDAGSDGRLAHLTHQVVGTPSRVVCSVSLRVEEISPGANATAFYMGIIWGSSWYGFGLDVDPDRSVFWINGALPGGADGNNQIPVPVVPAGAWTRVTIDTDFTSVALLLNGVEAARSAVPALPRSGYDVTLGIDTLESATTTATFRFDDVACVSTP